MARRPSDKWREEVVTEAAELASGARAPDETYAASLWPESLLTGTDAALADFEAELRALESPSDEQVFGVIERGVLALNHVNYQQTQMGYETQERHDLCEYIEASLGEAGIDVDALAARRRITRWEITDAWRDW